MIDLVEVVTVDENRTASERFDAMAVGVEVPFELGRSALAQTVDVENGAKVAELVVGGFVEGFPYRAFSELAVPAQHPHAVVELVEVLAGQRDADSDGQSLAQ